MPATLLHRVALLGRRRYRTIFAVTGALVALSLLAASRLEFDTDVLNLLPRDDPAVADFRRALDEFGSLDYLLIAVRVPPDAVLDPYEGFVDRLGERLARLDSIERVEYRLGGQDELVRTFLPRAVLFLDEDERQRMLERLTPAALEERARELRRLIATPQAFALEELWRLDPLGLSDIFLEWLTASRSGLSLDWASGYLLSRDHRMLLILARPVHTPESVELNRQLVAAVEAAAAATRQQWPELAGEAAGPPPEVALGGRYVIALGDEQLIRRDMAVNVLTSMVGVLLLFLFAFRRFGPLLYAFVPLACGLILTFGLAVLAFGRLSSATSGVAALLIGLGIDFVIVSYGRFVEERQAGASLDVGLARMSGSSGRAVIVGGVTSAATFYAFTVTDFTGLRQMGLLTGTGILLCMAAVVVLLPAQLAAGEDRYSRRRRRPRLFLHGFGSARLLAACVARPRTVLAAGLVVTAVAAVMATRLEFEDSVKAMRPRGNPGVMVREEVARHFGTSFDQMMLLIEAPRLDQALEQAERAAQAAREMVAAGELSSFDSITGLVPPPARQRRALAWLEEHRDRLDGERIVERFRAALAAQGMRADPFADGLEMFRQAVDRRTPVSVEELEKVEAIRRLLDRYLHRDSEGWTTVVYLYPPRGQWRRDPPPAAVALTAELGPGATLTGANVVSGFLRRSVLADALLAAVVGLVAVALLLWLDYRRLGDTLLSLAPLTVGIIWMLGAMAAFGLAMNFMNIFVSTMIIGIGVDYGVHMIHRQRELRTADRQKRIAGMAETGKAIALAAVSTMVGFGSMSLSHYPGLRSMGFVAVLGALATALVAITLLPAYFALRLGGAGEQENG